MKHWTRPDVDAAILNTAPSTHVQVSILQRVVDDLLAERDSLAAKTVMHTPVNPDVAEVDRLLTAAQQWADKAANEAAQVGVGVRTGYYSSLSLAFSTLATARMGRWGMAVAAESLAKLEESR